MNFATVEEGLTQLRNGGFIILADNEEHLQDNRQLSISLLLEGYKQVGKYMNLSFSSLLEMLQRLENRGYLRLINNFGNRYVEILELDADKLLVEHYQRIGR